MNDHQLKKAIEEDIITIKTLNPTIIPAKFYYGRLFKESFIFFSKMVVILILTLSYVLKSSGTDPITWSDLLITSGVISCFLSIFATIILLIPISSFVQFQFHFENKLKTGLLIKKKYDQISMVFFGVFSSCCVLFGSYASGQQILLMLVFSFFLSLGATNVLVGMELSRIGLSSLFTLIHEFSPNRKNTHTE